MGTAGEGCKGLVEICSVMTKTTSVVMSLSWYNPISLWYVVKRQYTVSLSYLVRKGVWRIYSAKCYGDRVRW